MKVERTSERIKITDTMMLQYVAVNHYMAKLMTTRTSQRKFDNAVVPHLHGGTCGTTGLTPP
jgi:hypothetical protein